MSAAAAAENPPLKLYICIFGSRAFDGSAFFASAIGYTAAALLLTVFMLPGSSGAASASAVMDVNGSTFIIRSEPYDDEADLGRGADSVVYGWMDSADRERLRGDAKQLMRVAATGVEPLPDADNPIDRLYPGPLVEGLYICFLKRINCEILLQNAIDFIIFS